MLDTFTLQTFSPLVASSFDLLTAGEDQRITLELTEALGTGTSPSETSREPFSLTFRGPGEPQLEQRTYPVSHPALGTFELFIVPVGRDADGVYYEAVFT
jgi:hypothetical protein